MNLPSLILLAAGKSSRMGEPKGLLKKNGEFWIIRQLNRYREAGGTKAIIVLGHDHSFYLTPIATFEKTIELNRFEVRTVVNTDPERGQFSSIQLGVKETIREPEAFLLPIDVPAPGNLVWTLLVQDHRRKKTVAVSVPTFKGQGGHPVLLSQNFMKKILENPAESTRLDHLIHTLPVEEVNRMNCDEPSIIINLNDENQWKQFP
jgi:molybdenum cofactor cytidylyltransferase